MADAPENTLRLGTRGSMLARMQSQLVADELESRHPGLRVELTIFKTSGDIIVERPLYEDGGKGLFTKELEQALLAEKVDFAVHSFKDVPVTMPLVEQEGLIVAAVPPRQDARDVLISPTARSLADLPPAARVGTGSLRRRCQILANYPALQVELIRGNIDTRLKKLRAGEYHAILLAMAGLRRSGLFDEHDMTVLDPDQMLPAAGQGALCLQCRKNDPRTRRLLAVMDDPATARCITAERAVVAALNGDCHSPIAAYATLDQNKLTLRVAVGGRDGQPPVIRAIAEAEDPNFAVDRAIAALEEQGVRQLLAGG